MSPSDILHEMREIKEQWRRDTFQASPEVRARYLELKRMRSARLKQLAEEGRIVEPGVTQS